MNILFLTNLLPFPLDNGGKIKTYTTLQALSKGGHNIDLICFKESEEENGGANEEVKKLCDSVSQIYLKLTTAENKKYMIKKAFQSLFSSYSFGIYKYISESMCAKIKEVVNKREYDYIYYDHLQMCVYKDLLDELCPNSKSVLDEHNCEALIMKRNAKQTKNFFKKIFLNIESHKLCKFEISQLKNVSRSIVLSKEDYLALKDMCGCDFNHEIIPIGVQDTGVKRMEQTDPKHLNIMFLGTLTWEPNNRGMIWFLKNVIPLLNNAYNNYSLYIVGKNPSQELKELANQYKNIIVTGYVDSVDEYYDKCQCMVVPLFIGSGQRVKIIEAFSKGMPVISTSIGAEGLGYTNSENILISDTEEEFVRAILSMKDATLRNKIAIEERQLYEKLYSPEATHKKILCCVKN